MRKKLVICISLLLIFIFLEIMLLSPKNKYSISYNLDDFKILEEYNYKIKDTYYLNIIHNDSVFSYQFNSDFIGKKIVSDIKYYEDDNLKCIFPLFNGTEIFDVLCTSLDSKSSSIVYKYLHNMEEISPNLNSFINSIKEYNKEKFNSILDSKEIDMYTIYDDIKVETYRGIINKGKKIDIFASDKYIKKLSTFTNNYYITPDYESNYDFNKFIIIDLKTNKVKELKLKYTISYSSYVQGVDKDIIYIYDEENKTQYKIDVKKLEIQKIGDLNSNINIYENNKWEKVSVSEINENIKFDFLSIRKEINNNYIDTINNYIYTFEKSNNVYKVYKSNLYTPNLKNYLFDIKDIDSIIYKEDYIYFKKDDYVASYSEKEGLKKIIQSNELLFNKEIRFTL